MSDLLDRVRGALVTRVEEKSPAQRAGLERGDLVIGIDGHPIERDRSFFEALKTSLVGQEIELEVWRDGRAFETKVVGEDLPDRIVDLVETGSTLRARAMAITRVAALELQRPSMARTASSRAVSS